MRVSVLRARERAAWGGALSAEIREEWVCTGVRLLTDGKLAHAWVALDAAKQPTGAEMFFTKFHASVGMVHEVGVTRGEGAIRASLGTFLRRHAVASHLAGWQAQADAARVAARIKADERKAKRADGYADLLRPIREAYASADPVARQVILSRVLNAIIRGGR